MSRTSRPQFARSKYSVRRPAFSARGRSFVRGGFTLVEMMVVIAILALLTALLVPAIFGAISRARNAAMSLEMAGIASALERYKQENGEYPPDFTTDPTWTEAQAKAAIRQQIDGHLAASFRYRDTTSANPNNDNVPDNLLTKLDPTEAMYFWLRGFSSLPSQPLLGAGDRTPLFDFDQSRLTDVDGDGFPEYKPKYAEGAPYVYFRAPYSHALTVWGTVHPLWSGWVGKHGHFVPYAGIPLTNATNNPPTKFAGDGKFQILCAGQDGQFGPLARDINFPYPTYPDGLGYTDEDNDNVTTFAEGSTLEDAKP